MTLTFIYILDTILKNYLNIKINIIPSYELSIIQLYLIDKVYWGYYRLIFKHLIIVYFLLIPLVAFSFIVIVTIQKIILIVIFMINKEVLDIYYDYPFDKTVWQLINMFFKNTIIISLILISLIYINNVFILPSSQYLLITEPVEFLITQQNYTYPDAVEKLQELYKYLPSYCEYKKLIKP